MTVRERLHEIPELFISQKLLVMNDVMLEEYTEALGAFTEKFPALEGEIKTAVDALDYKALSVSLAAVRGLLLNINADELAEECLKQMNRLTNVKHEKLEAYLTYFLSTLAVLSIDIQMALYKGDDGIDDEGEVKEGDDKVLFGDDLLIMEQKEVKKDLNNKILAVDDNIFFLDMLKRALQGTNFKLTCVTSGIAALKYLQNHRPNLFVFDIEMPEMNGYDLVREVRKRGHKAPVIFLTGNATKVYVQKAIEAGSADFIVKPINQKFVLERIGKFIKTS